MAGIASRTEVGEVDAGGADAVQRKGEQCAADTPALLVRIDGDHVDLGAARIVVEGHRDESDGLGADLGNPDLDALIPAHILNRTGLAAAQSG